MDDMFRKGRCPPLVGEKNGEAVLNWDDVKKIRTRYQDGETQKNISMDYPVTQAQISNIVTYKEWKEAK